MAKRKRPKKKSRGKRSEQPKADPVKKTPKATGKDRPDPDQGVRSAPSRTPLWTALALISLTGVLAYSNSFNGAMVFDDFPNIVENPSIRTISSQALSPPPEAFAVVARPLVNLSLATSHALSQRAVWGYHLVNLLVHILAALALFGVVRRTLKLVSSDDPGANMWVATAVALIWVAHPLHTEAVTYIIQRSEAMVGLFYLLTLYCMIRAATDTRRTIWNVVAVVCCALGMASKEVMVSAPVMVLLYDRVFLSRSFRSLLRERWALYVGLGATWALLLYLISASGFRESSFDADRSLFSTAYGLTQLRSVLLYLRLSFWPDPLVLDYGRELATGLGEVALHAVAVMGMLLTVFVMLVRRPWLGFLGAWFFAVLAPTTSIVFLNQVAHEHRMYLSLAAVVTLVVVVARGLLSRLAAPPVRRWVAVSLTVVVVLALAYGTRQRNQDYRSAKTLWKQQIVDRPGEPRPYNHLGALLMGQGKLQEAIRSFDKAIALKSDFRSGYLNRAEAHRRAGSYELAVADTTWVIRNKPDATSAYFARANAYTGWGRHVDAIGDYNEVIKLDPRRSTAYTNRGLARQKLGQLDGAIADFTQAITLSPQTAENHFNRGNAYTAAKRYDRAITDFTRAIDLGQNETRVFYNRGNAHFHAGHNKKAIADFTRAIELNPRSSAAYHNRAVCLLKVGAHQRAWADVQQLRTLGVKPDPALIRQLTAVGGAPQGP